MATSKRNKLQDNYTYDAKKEIYTFIGISNSNDKCNIPKKKVDSILKLYSNYDSNRFTTAQIAQRTSTSETIIKGIVKALGITRSALPVSPEKIETVEEDAIVQDLIDDKVSSIGIKFEKRQLAQNVKDAEKWRNFQLKNVDPFDAVLAKWVPPVYKPVYSKTSIQDKTSDKVFVVALSDLHYGSYSNAKYMFNNKGWSTPQTVEAVKNLADSIVREVEDRKYKFKKCVIIGMGDIIHSLLGKTQRGTELVYDCIKEEQFEYALNSLLLFCQRMRDCFGEIEVHSVGGNHHYELDMAIFKAIGLYFSNDKHAKFIHHSTRPAAFKCDNTLIMIDHGADSKERVYVPDGSKLERHVQSILLSNTHLLNDVKTKLFLQGDKHHFEHLEFNTFEFIMFSTILAADEHANINNWHNRARQSCLVLDKTGLREIIHVYTE